MNVLFRSSLVRLALLSALIAVALIIPLHVSFSSDPMQDEVQMQAAARQIVLAAVNGPAQQGPLDPETLTSVVTALTDVTPSTQNGIPVHTWNDYLWRFHREQALVVGRPRFYGRSGWLTVAASYDPVKGEIHTYVNDAAGEWAVDPATGALGANWIRLHATRKVQGTVVKSD